MRYSNKVGDEELAFRLLMEGGSEVYKFEPDDYPVDYHGGCVISTWPSGINDVPMRATPAALVPAWGWAAIALALGFMAGCAASPLLD